MGGLVMEQSETLLRYKDATLADVVEMEAVTQAHAQELRREREQWQPGA